MTIAAFGKYRVLKKIGKGGFGEVFKARDPRLKRLVAVKTCVSATDELRQRFFREAEIAANLQHPNIVTVFDFDTQDTTPYLVQEYLSGEDLDHKIRRRDPLEVETKIGYLLQIASGLDHAHAQGVVHRDVKPSNIRILEDGQVKIMDFGIAKLLTAEHELTKTGMTLGTAAYLPPEQIRGERVDPRADIFSFGVLAYELLTGSRPFQGDSFSSILYSIANQDPRPITDAWPQCPPRLAAMIDRCLKKDRDERYSEISEVIPILEALHRTSPEPARAGGSPVSAPTPPPPPVPSLPGSHLGDSEAAAPAEPTVPMAPTEVLQAQVEGQPGAGRGARHGPGLGKPGAPPGRPRAGGWLVVAAIVGVVLVAAAVGGWFVLRDPVGGDSVPTTDPGAALPPVETAEGGRPTDEAAPQGATSLSNPGPELAPPAVASPAVAPPDEATPAGVTPTPARPSPGTRSAAPAAEPPTVKAQPTPPVPAHTLTEPSRSTQRPPPGEPTPRPQPSAVQVADISTTVEGETASPPAPVRESDPGPSDNDRVAPRREPEATPLIVQGPYGSQAGTLTPGQRVYDDRDFTYAHVPAEYRDLPSLRTSNDNKTSPSPVRFTVSQDVEVFVAHDRRIRRKPDWLESFRGTGQQLTVDESGETTYYDTYVQEFPAGVVTLGANTRPTTRRRRISMYCVFLRPK